MTNDSILPVYLYPFIATSNAKHYEHIPLFLGFFFFLSLAPADQSAEVGHSHGFACHK